jgi:ABC-type lipoprotein export system ATPase subunit
MQADHFFDELHQAGNTIIIVTHEEEVAQRSQKIIRMRVGKIEAPHLSRRSRLHQQLTYFENSKNVW